MPTSYGKQSNSEGHTLSCSVGNGPDPTRVVYALTTPMVFEIFWGGIPRPVQTPPIEVGEEVT